MSLEKTVSALNQMVSDGIVSDYVIGGAMGALFYTEPFETHDLDIFVAFPETKLIVTLDPIYEYLKGKGYVVQGEHIVVEGMLVQILPIYDELVAEAATQALPKTVGQEQVRVMRPEHLLAIMAKLSRPKDKIRVHIVLDQADIDMPLLRRILSRYDLAGKWRKILPKS
jgi:hypothetical protein